MVTQDSTHNLTESSQPSWLAHKLQRRIVEPIGVIQVQQWPLGKTYKTIHRLVERSQLPNQIGSRYSSAKQVPAIELPSRSRVEQLEPTASLVTMPIKSSVLQRSELSTVQRSELPALDHQPVTPISSGDGFSATHTVSPLATPPTPMFRISRKPSANSISPTSTAVIKQDVDAGRLDSPAMPDMIRLPQSPKAELLMRQEDAEDPRVMAKSLVNRVQAPSPESIQRASEPTTPPPLESSPARMPPISQSTPEVAQPVLPIELPAAMPLFRVARSPLKHSSDMPFVQARLDEGSQSSTHLTDTGFQPIPRIANPTIAPSISVGEMARSPTQPVLRAIGEVRISPKFSEELPEKRSASSSLSRSLPVVTPSVSTTTTKMIIQPLTQSSPQSLAEVGSTESGVNTSLSRSPKIESPTRLALPLFHPIPAQTIVRQVEPTAQTESLPIPAIPAPPPPEKSTEPNADIQQIAEQVSRLLTRQLTIERERRGIQRW